MIEYIKIDTPFERSTEGNKKLIRGQFRNDSVQYLAENVWEWTEKIDGTNICVEWDGHRVSIFGRTERAEIPKHLMKPLEEMFLGEVNEEMFEQLFGDKHIILYGEGYGNKIQKVGSLYRDDCSFILFDIYQPETDLWYSRNAVNGIADALGIDSVKEVLYGTLNQAIAFVEGRPKSTIGIADMEGLVGRPLVEMKDQQGKRIIVKVKVKDFV